MEWRRHGVIWQPAGNLGWARSHASCPTPLQRRDGSWRVFLQCRDDRGVGRIGWIDLDPDDPRQVVAAAAEPALDVGAAGCFDDNGVFPTSVLRLDDGRIHLYYVGFELCRHIRYRLLTGLAMSDDDGQSFRRVRTMPVLERSDAEPHFRCGTFVAFDGGRFRMWYVAGGRWASVAGKPVPVYDMRYGESADGIHWPAQGEPALALEPGEHGFGRPWVRRDGAGYQMYYSVRLHAGGSRLGHARSSDARRWQRRDHELALPGRTGEWDGDGQCFAAPIEAGGRHWLLYNGNDFGGTGVGLAERLDA